MRRVVVLASFAALALGACGSSSLSMAQLRSQASRPCRAATRQLSRIRTPASPKGEAEFLKLGVAALAPELRALRRLRPPSDLDHDFANALGASARELAELRQSARRLATGGDPVVSIKMLQVRLAPLETTADSAWTRLGITACLSR
jgi:hypothetical protein